MYEEDDGEYPAYDEPPIRPRRKFKLYGGIALLIYTVIGGALAQTITLNTNGRVEFGQGVVTLKACDSFISVTLNASAATFSGTRANGEPYSNLSRVKSMKITGLDTKSCAGKKIKIQVFNSETTTAMSLYQDSGNLAVDRAIMEIDANQSVSREEAVSLINGYGQNIGYFSSSQYVEFNANRAEYLIIFTNPLAVMSDVTRVGLESTNA